MKKLLDAKPLSVCFFVTVPSKSKGMTGAVLGTQIVIEAVRDVAKTNVVEILHRRIRVSGRRVSIGSVLQYIRDYRTSRRNLARSLATQDETSSILYLCVASSLVGTLRDSATLLYVKRRFPQCKFVLHTRNGDFFFPKSGLLKRLRRWQLSRASRIICLSHRLLPDTQTLMDILPIPAQTKIHVVPNTIDEDIVAASADLEKKSHQKGPITVLYLSNFIPSKGYLKLGETIRLIAKAGHLNNYRFVFRGTWPNDTLKDEFRALFDESILASGAVDIGDAIWDRSEVKQAYLDADIFCLPTSYPAEAQPRSILEAMACGCVILANDHVSIADMVETGVNGFISKDISASQMAEFLMTQDRTMLGEQGRASRIRFDTHFSRATHEESIRKAIL